MIVYGLIVACVGLLYVALCRPRSCRSEDQGYIITNVQLPAGASTARTLEVLKQVEEYYLKQPCSPARHRDRLASASPVTARMPPWCLRRSRTGASACKEETADAIAGQVPSASFSQIKDAIVFPLNPPPIRELGNATGFTFRLQDRSGLGHDALVAARNQMLGLAAQSKVVAGVRPEGLEDAPQLQLDVDRDKANSLGVPFETINSVLSTALGSSYINDFPNQGRQQRVIVQADSQRRLQPDDLTKLYARSSDGKMVPFSSFMTSKWITGPVQLIRYNGYPAMKISGAPAPGHSTGEAMKEMESMMSKLPPGFGYEWTGQSLEEKTSGSQAPALYALSLIAVFLVLAALYESTSIPLSVMLVVPLGILGALLGVTLRGMPNDVYFKVGMIAVVGLSAKNAILIIEFAKDLQAQGKGWSRQRWKQYTCGSARSS
jgi:multidrug efflux pump